MTTFNTGFLCKSCGPVREMEKKTVRKVSIDCCKTCGGNVTKWSRPLNERAGRCNNCAHGSFKSRIHLGVFMRECARCLEVRNPDTNEIYVQGKEEFKYVIQ